MSKLQALYLNINSLTGSIPAELGKLSEIIYLDLNGNSLTGSIPTALGGLTDLKELYLQINSLTGRIPPAFRNLSNLEYLYVDNELCVPAHTALQDWLANGGLEFKGASTNICPKNAPTASDKTVATDEDTAYTFTRGGLPASRISMPASILAARWTT